MKRKLTTVQGISFIGMLLGVGGMENPETFAINPTAVVILLVSLIVLGLSIYLENKKQLRHRPKRRNCF